MGKIVDLVIILIGLAVSGVLFYRFPKLPSPTSIKNKSIKVSVIIPARNEENNIKLLLEDLKIQSFKPFEVICVDDNSSDKTAEVILSKGYELISLTEKPIDWTGKPWACHNGAKRAKGEIYLFLDADVRLRKNGIQKIVNAYEQCEGVVSVQPFHKTKKAYEQFSLIFNLVQIAGNGTALPKPENAGLFGPVICIGKSEYEKVGGHESVKNSIVEDMDLGANLKREKMPFDIFVGDEDVSFRMYPEGFKSLLQGWIKNQGAGALKIPLSLFIMVFLWITSLISTPLQLIISLVHMRLPQILLYSVVYAIWVIVLSYLSKRIGRYQIWAFLFYPILAIIFSAVFIVSFFKKVFRFKVLWKERAIKPNN